MTGNNTMNDVKFRMNELLRKLELKPKEFADATGLKYQQICDVNSGRTKKMPQSIIEAVRVQYPEINIEWLILGTGEMVKEEEKSEENSVNVTDANTTLLRVIDEQLEEIKYLKEQNRVLMERLDHLHDRNNDLQKSLVAQHSQMLELATQLAHPLTPYALAEDVNANMPKVADLPNVSPITTAETPQPSDT